jgi:hypothetical protein
MRSYFGNALGLYPKLFLEGRERREGREGEGRVFFQLVGVIVVPNSLILRL